MLVGRDTVVNEVRARSLVCVVVREVYSCAVPRLRLSAADSSCQRLATDKQKAYVGSGRTLVICEF